MINTRTGSYSCKNVNVLFLSLCLMGFDYEKARDKTCEHVLLGEESNT